MEKSEFLRFYANLPLNIRKEVVLVLDQLGPITWEVAYREVYAETALGNKIIEKLEELGFIPST